MGCCASSESRPHASSAQPVKPAARGTQAVRFEDGNTRGPAGGQSAGSPRKSPSVMSAPVVAEASTGVMCMRKDQADRELEKQRQQEEAERKRGFFDRMRGAVGDAHAENHHKSASKPLPPPRNDIEICSNHSASSEGWER